MSIVLFPYDTIWPPDAVGLTVNSVRIDGKARPSLLKKDESSVNLFDATDKWGRAELDLEVTCDPDALGEFEKKHGRVAAVVVANCLPTNSRQPVVLGRSEFDPGRWEGTLELDRENFRGRVPLSASLTATVDGVAHRPVGSAAGWTVHLDEPESLRLRGTLRVVWKNFKETADPPAKDFPESTHVAAFGGGLPEVWLNSAFEGLEPLLRDRRDRRGADRGLHDMQRVGIARSVWLALVADALAAVRTDSAEDGEAEPDWPATEWQAEVLRLVLPQVAPGKSDRELLKMAVEDFRSQTGAGEFFARAEAVIGDIVKANESLRRFVQNYRAEEAT